MIGVTIEEYEMEAPTRPSSRFCIERGTSMVEYTLLVALIALIAITAVGFLGRSATDSLTEASRAVDRGGAVEQSKTATYGNQIATTFEVVNGRVYLGDVAADGWTSRVVRNTERRVVVRFQNSDTGKVVRVIGALNRRDVLRTRIRGG